jgi:hypothetical protein
MDRVKSPGTAAISGVISGVQDMGKLTTRAIDARKMPGKMGDGDGLWLFISETGRESWFYIYHRGKSRQHTLGQ